ncbi:armadillo-type protein [Mycena latifolia]|nr:armadillo-type protein [Mycena latifolia]
MHHPLTRQPTQDSLHSWWSDRNPVGPTIDLHAAAKPLMRFMYRRDALALIAKNRGIPLSSEGMDIYSSYLAYKYVSSSTKTAILVELESRLESEDDARAVADSFVLNLADEFLSSSDTAICKSMCRILGLLAHRETAIPAVLRWNPCQQLVSLLSAVDIEVIMGAAETLSSIAKCAEGAQAVVDAKVFDSFAELLESPNEKVQKWLREIIGELIRHDTTARAATGAMVSLLRNGNLTVTKRAANIVDHIITSPLGPQALVAGNILDAVARLLEDSQMRDWMCDMLKVLADQPHTMAVAAQLVMLCRHKNSNVVESAARVLSSISTSPGGGRAVVDADVLECVDTLLKSSSAGVLKWTCDMLRELVHHATTPTVLRWNPCPQLVSLLSAVDIEVIMGAAETLSSIAQCAEGAQAVVDAKVLDCFAELLESPDERAHQWPGELVGELVLHDTTAQAATVTKRAANVVDHIITSPLGAQALVAANVLDAVARLLADSQMRDWTCDMLEVLADQPHTMAVAAQLVMLCHHYDSNVAESAAKVLSSISTSPGGGRAVVDADVLECVDTLLKSPRTGVLKWTCDMLRKLVHHATTAEAAVGHLASLLRSTSDMMSGTALFPFRSEDPNVKVVKNVARILYADVETSHDSSDVVEAAARFLDSIATSPDSAQAVVDGDLLDCVVKLLDSPNSGVKVWTCELLAKAAYHQSTRDRVLRVKPCVQLVSLLRDQDPVVVERSARTLSRIARVEEGAHAVVDAKVLDYVEELLDSPNTMVCLWTSKILAELARHGAIVPAILAVNPCPQLVSLMQRTARASDSTSDYFPVRTTALSTLARISETSDGAAAVAATQLMAYALDLKESPDHAKVQIIAKNLSAVGFSAISTSSRDELQIHLGV